MKPLDWRDLTGVYLGVGEKWCSFVHTWVSLSSTCNVDVLIYWHMINVCIKLMLGFIFRFLQGWCHTGVYGRIRWRWGHISNNFFLWRCDPTRVMASSFLRGFLDHTQRRTTVGRTPLDEWSARRRYLYLTTQNTHNRQTSMPPVGYEPTISAGERPQTYALDRAATGTGISNKYHVELWLTL